MVTVQNRGVWGLPDAAIICACFLWGLGAVVVKNAMGDTPDSFRVFVFNELRTCAASVLLFGAAALRGLPLKLHREHIMLVVLVTFFGMFLNIVTCMLGLKLSSATNLGIVYSTSPFIILILSFISGVERPSKILVIGILIGMTGVCALFYQGGSLRFARGDILLLISVLFWGVYVVFGGKILVLYNPLVAISWVMLLSSLFQLPLFILEFPHQTWSTISQGNWINLGIGTIGSFFLANALFFYAIHKLGPVRVGLYTNLEPVFTILLAYLIRGETISAVKIAGFVIILFGISITKIPLVVKL